ncbi:MAG: CD3324 family protein [Cellulosilyticaceae bacterium]
MKYMKAHDVLPLEVIELIQKYTDGNYLYIPRKSENQKAWGEASGTKRHLKARDLEIYQKHLKGVSISELAMMYYLSQQSIRRILAQQKKSCA